MLAEAASPVPSKPDTVVRQEFDSSCFKRAPYTCEVIRDRETCSALKISDRLSSNICTLGQIVLAPAEHRSGAATLLHRQCIFQFDNPIDVNQFV